MLIAIATGICFGVIGYCIRVFTTRAANARLNHTFKLVELAKKEWEAVFDAVNEMLLVVDDRGNARRVNSSCARAFGKHPRDLVGKSLQSIFVGHPEKWFSPQQYDEIDDPIFKTIFEVTRVRLGDQVILMARDVGEQRRLFSKLMQSEKMATIGVLAAAVAHEINNPAAYVMMNLHQFRQYQGKYEGMIGELNPRALPPGWGTRVEGVRREIEEVVNDSIDGVHRIRAIVSTLQSVSRRDPVDSAPKEVQLEEVIGAVAKTTTPLLNSRGSQLQVLAPEPCAVLGHRAQLIQVVLNIVVNAIQAEDGTKPNQITVNVKKEGDTAVISVTDTGKGIPEEQLNNIFEPFFTTKPEGFGTGLGLSISRDIVAAHGGTIEVSSRVNQGTTVTTRLPLLTHELPSPPRQSSAVKRDKRLKLLIVDDEPKMLTALERSLGGDHSVQLASDGPAALRQITANAYDVILCDVNMPGMDGLELHRLVSQMDRRLAQRFLFFTGQQLTEPLARQLEAAGLEALRKPLDPDELNLHLMKKVQRIEDERV